MNAKEKASALILKQEKEKLHTLLTEQLKIKSVVQFTMNRFFNTRDRISGKRLSLDISKEKDEFYLLHGIQIGIIGRRKRGYIYEARRIE